MFAEADVLKTKIRSRLSQHDALHGYQIARTHVHYTHTLILCILSNTRAPNPPLYGILNHIHHHTNISTNISTNKHFNKQAFQQTFQQTNISTNKPTSLQKHFACSSAHPPKNQINTYYYGIIFGCLYSRG